MTRAVYCTTHDRKRAEQIVEQLRLEGIRYPDMSVLLPDPRSTAQFAHEKHTKAPEGAAMGGAAGGVVGGTLGLLAGIGALAIPGLGPFIAAGPIMAALSGAAVGAGALGIAGALIGLGLPEIEAKRYESKVRGGRVLISVRCESDEQVERVRDIFDRYDAEDISHAVDATVTPEAAPTLRDVNDLRR